MITIDPMPLSLTIANGNKIKYYGQAEMEIVTPSLRRTFQWTFVIADVTSTLLGFDFLSHYELVIDCKNKTIPSHA